MASIADLAREQHEPAVTVNAIDEMRQRLLVALDDGPLVLVETRKDLSQLKLPFEASAG